MAYIGLVGDLAFPSIFIELGRKNEKTGCTNRVERESDDLLSHLSVMRYSGVLHHLLPASNLSGIR